VKVGEYQLETGGLGDDRPLAGGRRGRGAGVDPLFEDGEVSVVGPWLLAHRRHLAGGDLLDQRRVVGLAGDNLLAGDELVAVEDVIHAAFERAFLAVAAEAVRLENSLRLARQGRAGGR